MLISKKIYKTLLTVYTANIYMVYSTVLTSLMVLNHGNNRVYADIVTLKYCNAFIMGILMIIIPGLQGRVPRQIIIYLHT